VGHGPTIDSVLSMLVGSLLRGSCVAIVALVIGAVGAQAATAATVTFDKPCYLAAQPGLPTGQKVTFSGTGFTPSAPVSGTLDGTPIVSGSASSTGTINGSVSAPATDAGRFSGVATLSLSDGTNSVTADFPISNLSADFLPSTGNPRTQKVRYYLYGFDAFQGALGAKPHQKAYLHILDPHGKVRATRSMGRTKGSCGTLRSSRQRILPFEPIPGSWRYVFDLEKVYRKKTKTPRAIVFYNITRSAG
jgi:hypothetical protein